MFISELPFTFQDLHANMMCILQIHGSVSGRDFKSKMQTEHIELLQSPWLIELGAFHLNCDSLDVDEPVGFFKNGFFKNFSCDLAGTQPVMTMAISETIKYEYNLTCPICLVRCFSEVSLSYSFDYLVPM
jgi:E3 ubiquitin-protein ligase BAH